MRTKEFLANPKKLHDAILSELALSLASAEKWGWDGYNHIPKDVIEENVKGSRFHASGIATVLVDLFYHKCNMVNYKGINIPVELEKSLRTIDCWPEWYKGDKDK